MVLNYIWIAFFLIAFVVAVGKLVIGGDTAVFTEIINASFASAKTGFEISLGLTGILSLWLGIMKIGEKGGVIQAFARLAAPVFSKLFPDIPRDHPVTGSIFMNLSANLLGLDNAATPMGLKAMQQLQELNPNKESASNSMVMFLCINASGLTLIPITIMMYRAQLGIGVFRASGAMDFIIQGVRFGIASIGLNTDFVEALPTMLMKPLSGSGARGMMLDAMNTYGADSFVGRLSSIVQGSCDTTFYVVALYYGSVGIRNTRYTVQCALLADLAGAIAAIAMAYLFF